MPSDIPALRSPFQAFLRQVEVRAQTLFDLPNVEVPGWRIVEKIGEGGMGIVYKIERIDVAVGEFRALKVIRPGRANPEMDEFFRHEARKLQSLRHESIAGFFDYRAAGNEPGEARTQSWLTMEFVKGKHITKYCQEFSVSPGGKLALFEQLCEAVSYAHGKRIWHRDIKPENIMVVDDPTAGPRAKLLDFGIAWEAHEAACPTEQPNGLSRHYASPEQIFKPKSADNRTDIFSLGVVLAELYGYAPTKLRDCKTSELFRKALAEFHARLSDGISDANVVCIVKEATAFEPTMRYDKVASLARDVEGCRTGGVVAARRRQDRIYHWRIQMQQPLTAMFLLVAVALAGLLAVTWGWRMQHLRAQAEIRATRSQQLFDEIERRIDKGTYSVETTTALQELLAELDQLAPSQAQTFRDRIASDWKSQLLTDLRASFVSNAELQRIRTEVARFEVFAHVSDELLRDRLAEREQGYQQVFAYSHGDLSMQAPSPLEWRRGAGSSLGLFQQQPPPGDVSLEVSFDKWGDSQFLALLLDAPRETNSGYWFEVAAMSRTEVGVTDRRLRDAVAARRVFLRVSRLGELLSERQVAHVQADQPLRLSASRENNVLRFHLNDENPLEIRELFPQPSSTSEHFGLLITGSAEPTSAIAKRRPSAQATTLLGPADQLYAKGSYLAAADAYRQIHTADSDSNASRVPLSIDGQEAEFKEGVSLMRAGNRGDALDVYRRIKRRHDHRWRAAAVVKLCLQAVADRNPGLARDLLYEIIAAPVVDADHALSDGERNTIRDALVRMGQSGSIPDILRTDRTTVELERLLVQVDRAMNTPAYRQVENLVRLADAHGVIGEDRKAAELLLELLPQWATLDAYTLYHVTEQLAWLSLRSGFPTRQAMLLYVDEAERRMQHSAGAKWNLDLYRVRLLAAEGQVEGAQQVLEHMLREAPAGLTSEQQMEGELLRGFLYDRTGEAQQAEKCWKDAYVKHRAPGNMSLLTISLLGSLSGEINEADTRAMIDEVCRRQGQGFPLAHIINLFLFPPELPQAFRQMWRSPRGRDAARRHVFREVSVADFYVQQVYLSCHEMIRVGAFNGQMTEEQDQLTWNYVVAEVSAYRAKKTEWPSRLMPLYLAWMGRLPQEQWLTLEETLGKVLPDQRPYICYLLARRHRQLEIVEEKLTNVLQRAKVHAKSQGQEALLKIIEQEINAQDAE